MIKRFVAVVLTVIVLVSAVMAFDDNDAPVKILKKPRIETKDVCGESTLFVRLRVTFHESGKVTESKITVPSGCDEFDRQAVKAATGIKLRPARKDGTNITVVKQVEYRFDKY